MSDCTFEERIQLVGARTRQLDLSDSRLRGLDLSRAVVDGGVRLAGCRCVGQVNLVGARIAGALVLNAARLSGATTVLDARRVSVGDDILGEDGFCCDGELQISNADVLGSVRLRGARLSNPPGRTLCAVDVQVGGVVNCCEGFTAVGRINLSFARAGSQVCFERATLQNPDGVALSCRQVHTNELVLATATAIVGEVDLRYAHLTLLRDAPASWPEIVRLDGLTYDAIQSPASVAQRLHWLDADADGYLPQV
jgi:uncharacterized protein YjbI with pentapeptide repeats